MISRWNAPNGYKESLKIGMPLVVSMMSSTIMTFTDRIFLGQYSLDALGASLPASIAAFLFLSFFLGTAEYIGVFVSQYTGAQRHERVGAALWQGLWFCLPSGFFLASLWFIAEPLFQLIGHPPAVLALEVDYFRILTLGGGPFLIGICLSCFYSGRGLTTPVMLVNLVAMCLNIPFDYCLINGTGPFPELGIVGAGLATVCGYVFPAICFGFMVFTSENEHVYKVRSSFRLLPKLFKRFLWFGVPGGFQFFIDMFGVSFFVFVVGRLGEVELAATNIAISVYTLSFLPMVGMSIAASILVGQAMGQGDPDQAAYATESVLHLALLYMICMGGVFLLFPQSLMELFRTHREIGVPFDAVKELGIVLLRYIAAFTIIDAFAIIYMGALKGAGDTRFIVLIMSISSLGCLVLPLSLMSIFEFENIHFSWSCLIVYVCLLGAAFMIRFRNGQWRELRVIEQEDSSGS